MPNTLLTDCKTLRSDIKQLAARVKLLANGAVNITNPLEDEDAQWDRGEMISNAMLAYRHLEDSAMRLGKFIQAYDGGVSVYDK